MAVFTVSVGTQLDRFARRFGYRVFPEWVLHPSQAEEIDVLDQDERANQPLTEAKEYLRRDHPRLVEFREMYSGLDEAVRLPLVWTEKFAAETDLTNFRGDNMWVHQSGNPHLHERAYVLAAYYILSNDRLGLMQKFSEDGAFGARTLKIAGRLISRDMLDSILEIDFLDRHLQIGSRADLSLLDIGAGYGRMAHRMLTAFPTVKAYRCTDVVPESSFVCQYYLRYRGLEDRAKVVPSTEIDRELERAKINLAINIHSFSECTLDAVQWWMHMLAKHEIAFFMIVPNAGNHFGQLLRNNVSEDMQPIIERSGFRLIARDSKYLDPAVQRFALNPTYFWLFERTAGAKA